MCYESKGKTFKFNMSNWEMVKGLKMSEQYPVVIKDPFIVKDILSEEDLKSLQKHALNLWIHSPAYEPGFGRHQYHGNAEVDRIHNNLTQLARDHFGSQTLMPSWALLSLYEGEDRKSVV